MMFCAPAGEMIWSQRCKRCCVGSGLTDEQLRAEVATIIMGGFETTAHSLSFTVYCISTDQTTECAILQEMEHLGVLRLHKLRYVQQRSLTYEDMRSMHVTSSAIKEAMRLFPVVAGIPRYSFLRIMVAFQQVFSAFKPRTMRIAMPQNSGLSLLTAIWEFNVFPSHALS